MMFLHGNNIGEPMKLLNTTGKRIRVLREDLNLTQGEVRHLLKQDGVTVSQSYLSILERSDRVPSGEVIAGLAQVLRTSSDYILMLTDDPLAPGEPDEDAPGPAVSPDELALIERLRGLPQVLREALVAFVDALEAAAPPIAGGRRVPTEGNGQPLGVPRRPQSREDLVTLLGSLSDDVVEELAREAAGIIRKQERKA